MVANLLVEIGLLQSATATGGAGDLSADVVGIDHRGRKVVIQCKRYSLTSKIGSPDVQKFLGMATVHHRAERALFLTTATFTEPALSLARAHRDLLELVDGQKLATWLAYHRSPTGRCIKGHERDVVDGHCPVCGCRVSPVRRSPSSANPTR